MENKKYKMENNELEKVRIKNRRCYCFEDGFIKVYDVTRYLVLFVSE